MIGGPQMKAEIHPKIHTVPVTCACGAQYEVHSTIEKYNLDICSACHPFYTGKQKLMDTAGRVERFNKKYAKHQALKDAAKPEAAASEAAAPEAAAPEA